MVHYSGLLACQGTIFWWVCWFVLFLIPLKASHRPCPFLGAHRAFSLTCHAASEFLSHCPWEAVDKQSYCWKLPPSAECLALGQAHSQEVCWLNEGMNVYTREGTDVWILSMRMARNPCPLFLRIGSQAIDNSEFLCKL